MRNLGRLFWTLVMVAGVGVAALASLFFFALALMPPFTVAGTPLAVLAGVFWAGATCEIIGAFFDLLREGP